MKLAISKLAQFDEVTRFRLINAFVVTIGLSLIAPVLIILKGTLLAIWVISLFSIFATIAVKANDFLCQFSISQLYQLGIFVHVILVIAATLYFVTPLWMVILESLVGIIEVAVFSSYSILLNDLLTKKHPKSMKQFQIIRNNSWADGSIIGLVIVTAVTYFFSVGIAVGLFIVYNSIFSGYMIWNWNFYKEKGL